ncbi:MAG: agmatinase [Deltaproteobacteria bacterium]|nr:agmatinase [Deltaproteobacteria bacterium]
MSTAQKHRNFLGIPPEYSAREKAKAVILPLPFDKTCSWLSGTSKGPDAIIEASMNMELFDIETRTEVYKRGIYTAPAVHAETGEGLNAKAYLETKRHLDEGRFVIALGGEHSVSYGPIMAHAEKFKDISILQIDAHTDMRDTYEGNKFSHACIMARAKEFSKNIVQVGIRSLDQSEYANIDESKVYYAEQIHDSTDWIDSVVSKLGNNVYITIDVDAFDISIMPSTGTPEPGGLGWYQVLKLLKTVFQNKAVVGCDVVELAPTEHNRAPDFLTAKLVYKLLTYRFEL